VHLYLLITFLPWVLLVQFFSIICMESQITFVLFSKIKEKVWLSKFMNKFDLRTSHRLVQSTSHKSGPNVQQITSPVIWIIILLLEKQMMNLLNLFLAVREQESHTKFEHKITYQYSRYHTRAITSYLHLIDREFLLVSRNLKKALEWIFHFYWLKSLEPWELLGLAFFSQSQKQVRSSHRWFIDQELQFIEQ